MPWRKDYTKIEEFLYSLEKGLWEVVYKDEGAAGAGLFPVERRVRHWGQHNAHWAKTSPRECGPTMSGRPAEWGGEESLSCQCPSDHQATGYRPGASTDSTQLFRSGTRGRHGWDCSSRYWQVKWGSWAQGAGVDAPGETGWGHYCLGALIMRTSTKSSYNYIWKKSCTIAVKRK